MNVSKIAERVAGSLDATREYKIKVKDVHTVLGKIEKSVKEHEKRQAEDPNNYGYEGDMGHALGLLHEVNRFLGGI